MFNNLPIHIKNWISATNTFVFFDLIWSYLTINLFLVFNSNQGSFIVISSQCVSECFMRLSRWTWRFERRGIVSSWRLPLLRGSLQHEMRTHIEGWCKFYSSSEKIISINQYPYRRGKKYSRWRTGSMLPRRYVLLFRRQSPLLLVQYVPSTLLGLQAIYAHVNKRVGSVNLLPHGTDSKRLFVAPWELWKKSDLELRFCV